MLTERETERERLAVCGACVFARLRKRGGSGCRGTGGGRAQMQRGRQQSRLNLHILCPQLVQEECNERWLTPPSGKRHKQRDMRREAEGLRRWRGSQEGREREDEEENQFSALCLGAQYVITSVSKLPAPPALPVGWASGRWEKEKEVFMCFTSFRGWFMSLCSRLSHFEVVLCLCSHFPSLWLFGLCSHLKKSLCGCFVVVLYHWPSVPLVADRRF